MEQNTAELWIDDLRNPVDVLGLPAGNIVWKKEAWEARNYLFHEAAPVLEKLYLDHNLDSMDIDGEDLIAMVAFRLEMFPCLKAVYLHSSDDEAVEKMLSYKPHFDKRDIDLLVAPYRNKNC